MDNFSFTIMNYFKLFLCLNSSRFEFLSHRPLPIYFCKFQWANKTINDMTRITYRLSKDIIYDKLQEYRNKNGMNSDTCDATLLCENVWI